MRELLILILIVLAGCSKGPTAPPVSNPPVVSTPDSPPAEGESVREKILSIAGSSACAKMVWGNNRGKAPAGYIKGLALGYAKQVCGKGSSFIEQEKIRGNNSVGPYRDALEYYGLKGSALNTYTLLAGLGMRESSGRYCEGRDRSANFTAAQDAEAGIYQSSYVSRVFNSELKPLYDSYKAGNHACDLEVFKEGVTCGEKDFKNWGSGEGARWQAKVKSCPMLGVQWNAILIRSQYRHFGPLIHKAAQYDVRCMEMLKRVGEVAIENCREL